MKTKPLADDQNPRLDRWVQRLTTTALLALAASLLGTGIAFYF